MKTKPLISILMPVYNADPWLAECLDSILAQMENEWELIAIDDYSTDSSLAILKAYAAADSRIQIFRNDTKGIIPALQLAFLQSGGTFITRMDADDKMAPEKLLLLKEALVENGPGHIATGWVQYISPTKLGDGYIRYESWLNELTTSADNYKNIYKECVIPSPCWMTTRSDLIRCGAFDSKTYPEDYDLCFRFYKNQLKVLGVKKVLHYWRDHQNRTSRNSPTYADHRYFDLKLPYFLELDYDANQSLVLWGTGKKGKLLAQKLVNRKINFLWVTNNIRKQGINIYGIKIESFDIIAELGPLQAIIAVAAPADQLEIIQYLEQLNSHDKISPIFFC